MSDPMSKQAIEHIREQNEQSDRELAEFASNKISELMTDPDCTPAQMLELSEILEETGK